MADFLIEPMVKFLRSHPWRAALAVLLILCIAALAYSLRPAAPAAAWLTAPVQRMDLEDTVMATGTIRAARMLNVGAQATGQVKTLHVKVGDRVKKGQLIAEIDATTQQNTLRDDLASLESIKAQRAARESALQLAQVNLQRQQQMMARDATSRAELQAAENALAAAQADIRVSHAQMQQAQIKIETSRANLGYTRIVAPMDGTVVAVITEQGQTVNAAMSSPTIVKLAQLDVVQIEAQISEADVARVKPGLAAYFTLLGEPDERHPTRLQSIDLVPADQARDSGSGSGSSGSSSSQGAVYYNGVLLADNPQGKLRVSMTAQVFIVAARAPNALGVPTAALGTRDAQGHYEVRVLTQDAGGKPQVQIRKVKIGLNNRVHAQVLDGLQEGESVVVGKGKSPEQAADADASVQAVGSDGEGA